MTPTTRASDSSCAGPAGGGHPLLAVLVVVETTDVLFAVDSIPAIFAVTTDPFLVFTSNAFAILGLRALYFLLAGMVERFVHLKLGLAAVLVFVGASSGRPSTSKPPSTNLPPTTTTSTRRRRPAHPLGHPTINLHGRYRTTSRPPTRGLRPSEPPMTPNRSGSCTNPRHRPYMSITSPQRMPSRTDLVSRYIL